MRQRKWNALMIGASLVGTLIGFAVGEWLLLQFSQQWPHWVLIGSYFGQLAFWIGLLAVLAEIISPRLNGMGWKQRYAGNSWKMLVPSTLVMLFAAGALLQAIYGYTLQRNGSAENIVLLLDVSSSMNSNDPSGQLFRAATNLVNVIDDDKRIAVIAFNSKADLLQPLTALDSDQTRQSIIQKLSGYEKPDGGTDFNEALKLGFAQIQPVQQENSMMVLMSDGHSSVDYEEVVAPLQQAHVPVHTVGMSAADRDGTEQLKKIAEQTAGGYYDVADASQLTGIFEHIYKTSQEERHLVGERTGALQDSLLYGALRVISLLLIGTLLGLSLGLVFDNKYLAQSFMIGGTIAGLLAGLLLEKGLSGFAFTDALDRMFADAILGIIVSLFAALIPIPTEITQGGRSSFRPGRFASGKSFRKPESFSSRFDSQE
ncbi:vWA domain-containing protein [Brevibacillus migulae]|uniref:vWA domain-containing protein n=1 Tax=Brevibacillus migulae TaxID=1644114 RepID=UPI00106ECCC1|nr:VWA domain-containing protein [Brevibacillus migulae]